MPQSTAVRPEKAKYPKMSCRNAGPTEGPCPDGLAEAETAATTSGKAGSPEQVRRAVAPSSKIATGV